MALPAPKHPPRNSLWRDLSEQTLLDYEFTITGPEKLEGMSLELPPPGEFNIESAYDLRGRDAGLVRCVHCKYPNHFRGFVVRFSDDTRRLVGKVCGEKFYGGEFEDQIRDFKTARDLATALKRRRRVLTAENILTNGLMEIRATSALRQFSRMAWDIHHVLKDEVISELQSLAKRGDALTVTEKVRDYAAEEKATDDLSPEHAAKLASMNRVDQKRYRKRHNLPDPEKYKWLNRSLGPIKGTALLYPRFSPVDQFSDLAAEISNCYAGLKQNRRWTATSLSLAMQHLTQLIERLERDIEKLKAPFDFFEATHLAALCEWSKRRTKPVDLRHGMGWIERDGESGYLIRAEFNSAYVAPPASFLPTFKAALD